MYILISKDQIMKHVLLIIFNWTQQCIYSAFPGTKAYDNCLTFTTRQSLQHKSSNNSGTMRWFKHQSVWLITIERTTGKHKIPESKLDKNIYSYPNESKPLATQAFSNPQLFS